MTSLSRKPDPMTDLCHMVVNTNYKDLPDAVVKYAKSCILDTLAVIIGGSAMEGVSTVVNFVKEKGGKPQSLIPIYGCRVPASEAAFAIGPMARAMDMGDAHMEGGHCSEYIIPALLAATGLKKGVSGKEFITSFVVGSEVLLRIGIAYRVVTGAIPRGQIGGHYIFGCIASVCKLLGSNLEELKNAIGIGRGMTQPHDVAMLTPPSLMVRIHHGFIAQDAINACLLAKEGITGPCGELSDILLGSKGYLAFAGWQTDPEALTNKLGEKWEMLNLMMKPYPSCGCTHTPIEGIIEQMERYNFKVDDMAVIDIDASPVVWAAICIPKEQRWNPLTVPECQFSLPYAVATAAFDKDVFLSSFTQEARTRPEVRDLMKKVSAREDTSLPPFAVRINTRLNSGKEYSGEYFYAKGHPQKPFTEKELVDKFKKCVPYSAYKLEDDAVNTIINSVLNLEKIDSVTDSLINPLVPV